ncbi:MAG TPA: VOC family protein [Candidatus Paceibacterota bacterium]|nr:VOC family protein [Candidatus Paceibacterota bacterium]
MPNLSLVVIRTPDIEKTRQFYERLLGVSFAREQHGGGPVHYAVELQGKIVFEIYPGIKTDNVLGFRTHFINGCINRASPFFSKPPRLTRAGDRITHAVLYDPDGRRVELTE